MEIWLFRSETVSALSLSNAETCSRGNRQETDTSRKGFIFNGRYCEFSLLTHAGREGKCSLPSSTVNSIHKALNEAHSIFHTIPLCIMHGMLWSATATKPRFWSYLSPPRRCLGWRPVFSGRPGWPGITKKARSTAAVRHGIIGIRRLQTSPNSLSVHKNLIYFLLLSQDPCVVLVFTLQ